MFGSFFLVFAPVAVVASPLLLLGLLLLDGFDFAILDAVLDLRLLVPPNAIRPCLG